MTAEASVEDRDRDREGLELQKMTKSLLLVAMLASLIQLAASSPIYVKVIFV
jgi:hypothetical protein